MTPADEMRVRMIEYIARRDRVTKDQAKAILARLPISDLTRLEMELRIPLAVHTHDYDPFARG